LLVNFRKVFGAVQNEVHARNARTQPLVLISAIPLGSYPEPGGNNCSVTVDQCRDQLTDG
jgi:hypothetical protein